MTPRPFSLLLAAFASLLFLGVGAANVIIDPEGVFGTGVFPEPLNTNHRFLRIVEFQKDPDRYDGLLFGSSRAAAIPLSEVSRDMGATFKNFDVVAGQIPDHMAVLDYVTRIKAARGKPLRAVFLLIDIDSFGSRQIGNRTIQTMWAPELRGETRGRFFWRYLTVIQPKAWRGEIGRAWSGQHERPATERKDEGASLAPFRFDVIDSAAAAEPPEPQPKEKITARIDFGRDLALLTRFVALCRAQDIRLAVAISPLRRIKAEAFDPDDLAKAVGRIAEIVPVWDFGIPDWLDRRPEMWIDEGHFDGRVAKMMLDRMFGVTPTDAPADFGVLRRGAALARASTGLSAP